ncbi:hypothetical protein CDCA_CDCA12G3525 [Cyanidium caldarium]|uniref:Nuclear pore localisation protein NPL4 C-terminal domain-containing protein n=1 Tax=Cyanidium caldarium TaxID=2771 RepID=A0AAV9IYU0_CYACA|nr:hypothetical protein CDCA_CDCA12G3525 [Cyanidium caldarium]
MLIRLRKEDGSVVRLEVSEIATVGELRDEILRRGLSNNLDLVLSRDARGSDPTARLEDASAMLSAYGLHHGDMVYIAREDWVCGEMQQGGTWTGTAVEEADAAALEAPPPRLVGGSQRGLFTEAEYAEARAAYRNYVEASRKQKQHELLERRGLGGRRGMTVDFLEWLDAQRPVLKSQDDSPCSQCAMDLTACDAFQSYLARVHDSQMRYGILYGTVAADSGLVKVDTIFEPPQQGDRDVYLPAEGAAAATAVADKLAEYLGLVRVGWIFSHHAERRDYVMSDRDVAMAAHLHLQTEQCGQRFATAAPFFVTIAVAIQSNGQRHFEAYQLSEQCLQMARAGLLIPMNDNGRMRTLDEVRVEAANTTVIETDFFLVVVPIVEYTSWLRTAFPVEHRDIEPQTAEAVARTIASGRGKFTERLADFHLLLFLSRILDMDRDMPALVNAVVERRELEPTEQGYQVLIESLH